MLRRAAADFASLVHRLHLEGAAADGFAIGVICYGAPGGGLFMVASLLFLGFAVRQEPLLPAPRSYLCQRASGAIVLDGRLDEAAWARVPFTDHFVDIEGSRRPTPRFRTRAKMLWDDKYLYIGAELEEPHVRATLSERDSVIFHDNDFEVFMDPDDDGLMYSELEMNALNTTWDLLLPHPYRTGGPALTGWDIKGLRTAVHVDGTLNDSRDKDRGWSVEIAIPWSGIAEICHCACPPRLGDQWRINFSRVEWQTRVSGGKYETVPGTREDNWVWSPQGAVDMHIPDRWGVLQFASSASDGLRPLDGWMERQELSRVWEAEGRFRRQTGRWASSAADLGLSYPGLTLYATPSLFEAAIGRFHVDEQLRFWKSDK